MTSSPHTFRDNALYRIRTPARLAKILQISMEDLSTISSLAEPYRRRWKSKKGDIWRKDEPLGSDANAFRPIDIPDRRLKRVQARIAFLLSKVTPPDWLFSPVKGRSYVDNAARHKAGTAFWLLDIEDYFPSCSGSAVAGFFLNQMDCSKDVTAILTRIVTNEQALPQGSPCSPILAYFSKYDMWKEIGIIVQDAGLIHSVYADDITISGSVVPAAIIWDIKKAVRKHGLSLSTNKEVSLFGSAADVTGVIIVNGELRLPNRQYKKLFELRARRHTALQSEIEQIDRQIAGRVAQRNQVELVS